MQPILEVKNLTKKFNNFIAVDNISFCVNEGEVLGFLGPNGAGKTTTIQMLLGVMTPTSGTISYFGKQFEKYREEILKDVNYSSTYISLPAYFTVAECLQVFARLYEVPDKEKRIIKLLSEFEIERVKNKQFYMCSAGEKTTVLLVKAFLNYPKIILLDEPTASLDPDIAVRVRRFLKKEKKEYNTSMLFTSHNMAEVEEMSDRIIILNHGKIIDENTPEKLANRITQCFLELTIAKDAKKAEIFFKEKHIQYVQEKSRYRIALKEKDIASFLSDITKENIIYEAISIDKPDLEDYFLQAIGVNT